VYLSGIHDTLAGVIVALALPIARSPAAPEHRQSPLLRVEHALAPVVAFAIVPVFGFFNAGVDVRGLTLAAALDPLVVGIVAGLVLGKQIGIFGAIMALVRSGAVNMPAGATTRQIWGLSLLCGIGFTMSLFIGGLAFGEGSAQESAAKLGIIAGSVIAALAGVAVLAGGRRSA
ncbi:MAG: Na+/H+ antiporter NhaA, partial [Sandarakinorhabdus sp.]